MLKGKVAYLPDLDEARRVQVFSECYSPTPMTILTIVGHSVPLSLWKNSKVLKGKRWNTCGSEIIQGNHSLYTSSPIQIIPCEDELQFYKSIHSQQTNNEERRIMRDTSTKNDQRR